MSTTTTTTSPPFQSQNELAQHFKSLHQPSNPLILTNIWDCISAKAVASLPSTTALATASYAVAAASGIDDAALSLPDNLRAIGAIAKVAAAYNKPLTADFQDGYGAQLEEGVTQLIKLGVVGCNLEDFDRARDALYDVDEAVARIETVLRVAAALGVPDFVVNARTDALVVGLDIDEAVRRGKRFLQAGATTAFIWGGKERPGVRTHEVELAARELGGRLNVSFVRVRTGGLELGELRRIGVARVSVGPQLMMRCVGGIAEEAERILRGEKVESAAVVL